MRPASPLRRHSLVRVGAAALALGWIAHGGPAAADPPVDPLESVRDYRRSHQAEILAEYRELLAIPNVASDSENIRRNAEWIAAALEARGVSTEIWTTGEAPPIVFGRLEAEDTTRTLGIYVHYDGQPVDAKQWTTPPWEPALLTGSLESGGVPRPWPAAGESVDPEARIYARSAGDDKAPIPAILTALDALREAGIAPTSDLVFLLEGEEEAGSDHLGDHFREHRDELQVDLWLIADGPVHQSRRPQLVFGVRGYSGFDITVYGASRYLHSGHYGNWAPNPAQVLAGLLAGMKGENGMVTIRDFYADTAPITQADREAISKLPDYDAELRRELGLHRTEAGNAPLAERILLPSLNVRGMASAAVGAAARNIIPTEATASLDVRLAKGDRPAVMLDRVEAHIREQGFTIVREQPDLETRLAHSRIARVVRRSGYPAVRTELDHPAVAAVRTAAERAAGEEVLMVPTLGGSLPLYLFVELLEAPVVIIPIANHDDNQHAPDENLRLANLWYGIDLMGALLTISD
ncbi:MAG: M20/M25/M40 family metallo-hydrolase [Thermoanaerobaculia bacterium]